MHSTINATSRQPQQGLSFISWLVVIALIIFLAMTAIKIVPMYLKFNTIQSLMDDIAANTSLSQANKTYVFAKIDDYININGINDLSSKDFEFARIKGQKQARLLSIQYEDRQLWFANLDIIATFDYSTTIGAQNPLE
ncbi:MAG TPA: DUF4845 domain-containing protein [Thiothrix sp.]|nr:DUF4845 domain-containing protein [Thiothrix sp.]